MNKKIKITQNQIINTPINELDQWMDNKNVANNTKKLQLVKGINLSVAKINNTFKAGNQPDVSVYEYYNIAENLLRQIKLDCNIGTRPKLRPEFIKSKSKARKELGLGIYIPFTYLHLFSTQLRKIVGKRTRLSVLLKRRVASRNILKRIRLLNKKISAIINLKNSIRNINNKVILKNNIVKKEVNINKINIPSTTACGATIQDFKTLNNTIILPDYITENNNWRGKLLNLNLIFKRLQNIKLNKKQDSNSSNLLLVQNNKSRVLAGTSLVMQRVKPNKLLQENKLNNITRSLHYDVSNIKPINGNLQSLNKEFNSKASLSDDRNNNNNNNNLKIASIDQRVKVANLINSVTHFYQEEANSQYLYYQFSKKNKYSFKVAEKLLKLAFLSMGCLISKPIFSIVSGLKSENSEIYFSNPQSKIIIKLFYFFKSTGIRRRKRSNRDLSLNRNRLNIDILAKYKLNLQYLVDHLANLFKSEIRLELVELKKPHYNSNILAQYLGLKSYKYRFVKLIKVLFRRVNIEKPSNIISFSKSLGSTTHLRGAGATRNSIFNLFPSFLAGIRIRLGGRTFKQKVIPRRTVQLIQKGSLNRDNVKLIEKARFTGKTRRGSYSFTVTLGHVF